MTLRLLHLRSRGLLLLLLALALGGAAVWLAAGWLDRAAQASAREARESAAVETVRLLVAARDLEPGDVLTPAMLTLADWPRPAVQPQHLVAQQVPPARLAGGIVRMAVAAGQPLTATHVIHRGEQGVLAALIAPGRRAVTIPVNAAAGLAGLVGPGDRVDILLTAALPGSRRIVGLTVVDNVRVLGVDRRLKAEQGDDQQGPPATVTLEVTPRQAEAMAVAQEMGRLSLSLRNLAREDNAIAPGGGTWDSDVTRLPPATLAEARVGTEAALIAPAVAASAAPATAMPVQAAPAGNGPAVENGVQVVRGSSIRSAMPPPGSEDGSR
jgi:pilus assembly protein CpaB